MSKIKKYKKCRKYGSTIFEKCSSQKYAISEQKKRFSMKGRGGKWLQNMVKN